MIRFFVDLFSCIFGRHKLKTIGFWADRKEGEFEVACQNCHHSFWTDDPPDKGGLIPKLIQHDRDGKFLN